MASWPIAFSPFFSLFLASLYLIIIIANGVHSFGEKKTLNVHKLQLPKPQLGPLGCLLPESSKFINTKYDEPHK